MSVGLPSDEVAEDYKNSLEDLSINSRYEINNLTVIAKENTEHAMAISRVLENHIKHTPPDRKILGLYVLDSVVKNVGTPYTLFLGRNLYSIFMNAYSLVDKNVRKKLDEMLKTWKEPVPGSLDTRPVFSPDITRPIENALIKARTAAVQQQQQQQSRTQQEAMMARGRAMATANTQWRNTPTPPQANGRFQPPPVQGYLQQQSVPNGAFSVSSNPPIFSLSTADLQEKPQPLYPQHNQYVPQSPAPTSYQQAYQPQPAYPQQQQSPQIHLASLQKDIDDLIKAEQASFVIHYQDQSIQTRLHALLALQTILRGPKLPLPHEMQQIRDQVAALSVTSRPLALAPNSTPALPQYAAPQQISHLSQPPPPQQLPTPIPQGSDLQAMLSSNNLAAIIAKAKQSSSTPISQASLPQSSSTSLPQAPTPSTASGLGDLMATLRAKGMLPAGSNTPANNNVGLAPPPSTTHTPPTQLGSISNVALSNDVELTSASLKRPRPHLISSLYEARPNQCSTCGKRFLATEQGREKKARHLDWHFRSNQRLADSAKRGQSRSWYVDEMEWIKSRDNPEDAPYTDASSAITKAAIAAALAAADPKNKHIPAPSDPALANEPCSICQEKFSAVWNDDAQDFVWMDATKVGSRIYHASCYEELKMGGGSTPRRTDTPDSVLGKRKAGIDINMGSVKAIKA